MDSNPPKDEAPQSSSPTGSPQTAEPLNDLLALIDEHENDESSPLSNSRSGAGIASGRWFRQDHLSAYSRTTNSRRDPRRQTIATENGASPALSSKPMELGVDDRLGIRMIDRIVSSVDVLDLLSDYPYHSPATLSAMSLTQLTQVLIDPPRIIDVATVFGKTNLVTVGIVFSNTGTRISSKGSAFCVLTIGNFASGPCVSVLLFGEVYSKHASCVPGKVVALVNPKLLPQKELGSATTVSFTVHDNRQFLLVAKARDYGTCQATVPVKQPDGTWTSRGKCKNHVDKRFCQQYCLAHRKHGQRKVTSCNSQRNGMTYIQQLRNDQPRARTSQTISPANTIHPTKGERNVLIERSCNPVLHSSSARINIGFGEHAVPMHMTKQRGRQIKSSDKAIQSLRQRVYSGNQKQFLKRQAFDPIRTADSNKQQGTVSTQENWLQADTKRRGRMSTFLIEASRKEPKRSKLNTSGGGFDGSVPIPKPSTLFRSCKPKLVARAATSCAVIGEDHANLAASIRLHQSEVAQKLQDLRSKQPSHQPSSKPLSTSSTPCDRTKMAIRAKLVCPARGEAARVTVATGTARWKRSKEIFAESFHGSIAEAEEVRNAKSRFSNEADAEEYARSRQVVTELEKLESNTKVTRQNHRETKLKKEWICMTCGGKAFSLKPTSCISNSHCVKFIRDLNKDLTTTDKRLQLQEKSTAEGGLRLGAGLEWRRQWNRFS